MTISKEILDELLKGVERPEDRYCTLRSGISLWAWAASPCRGMPRQGLPILVFHGVATRTWRKVNGQAKGCGG